MWRIILFSFNIWSESRETHQSWTWSPDQSLSFTAASRLHRTLEVWSESDASLSSENALQRCRLHETVIIKHVAKKKKCSVRLQDVDEQLIITGGCPLVSLGKQQVDSDCRIVQGWEPDVSLHIHSWLPWGRFIPEFPRLYPSTFYTSLESITTVRECVCTPTALLLRLHRADLGPDGGLS